ncbi:MAG TPA: GntR family transcriptional regulator, partial [Planctomycetota bacterium]|nr:GntR family transcriptional regulator [Planctomycetota bacterium]
MPRPNVVFNALLTRLRQQIRLCVHTGQPLPSQRSLADMHACGQASVHRALKVLAKEGLVRSRPSQAWVRRAARESRLTAAGLRVGLITRRARHTWEQYPIYAAILKEGARRGVEVVEVPYNLSQRFTPRRSRVDLQQVPWNTFDVALLVETEDSATLSDPLLRRHRVIAVDHDATVYGIDSVIFNNRLA